MNTFIIIFNGDQEGYDSYKITDFIKTSDKINDWWHYLPNTYIVTSSLNSGLIGMSIRNLFPNLLYLITQIDLATASGTLPKEAWEWINNKVDGKIKIKPSPKIKIKERPNIFDLIAKSKSERTKKINTGNKTLDDLFNPKK